MLNIWSMQASLKTSPSQSPCHWQCTLICATCLRTHDVDQRWSLAHTSPTPRKFSVRTYYCCHVGSWWDWWVHDWCAKAIQQFQVINHTNKCPIHFITYNRDIITLLTNFERLLDALTSRSFLKKSSDTSGDERGALQRTQPVKNRDKTRIILLSRV